MNPLCVVLHYKPTVICASLQTHGDLVLAPTLRTYSEALFNVFDTSLGSTVESRLIMTPW